MKDDTENLLFTVAIVAIFFSFLMGLGFQQKWLREEAVKANVAYWTANEKGEVQFKWITE